MDAPDTSASTDVEVVEPDEQGADPFGLGALFGGLDMRAMMANLGVELPDPDSATLDDLADQLDELSARVDWIASALQSIAAKVPNRFVPELPSYPPTD